MDVGEETWLECMQLGPPYSVDRVLSDEGAHPEPPYNWPAGPLFDQLQLANLFKPTCKPTARCRTVSDTTFTTDSSADPDILLSASAVTASPHTFDILAGACPQPPTYPPGHPATWAPSPDVALTGQPPSSTSLHFDLDTTSKPLNSPYVALDDASSLQANFRREVGSQAQTEASIKRRRASARSSSAYVCECCPKTFTRKKNLQDHLRRHDNRREYACQTIDCSSRFNTLNDRQRHVKIVHTQRQVSSALATCDLSRRVASRNNVAMYGTIA